MLLGKNYFYSKNKYICYSKWKDNYGTFIFPAVMFDKRLPISPELKVNRLTIFFLKNRYVFDFGVMKTKKPFIWEDASISRLIDWIRTQGKGLENFTKKDLEVLIKSHPKLTELLTDNGADMFYVREMVLEMHLERSNQQQNRHEYNDFNF